MSRHKSWTAAGLAAAALTLGAFGCGDDEDTTPSISLPEVTEPSALSTTEPTTVTDPTTTTAPTVTDTVKPPVEDSETNDVPPPPGSPQAKFEKACEKNPAACG